MPTDDGLQADLLQLAHDLLESEAAAASAIPDLPAGDGGGHFVVALDASGHGPPAETTWQTAGADVAFAGHGSNPGGMTDQQSDTGSDQAAHIQHTVGAESSTDGGAWDGGGFDGGGWGDSGGGYSGDY